jgi:hypothetical protein
MHDMMEDYFSRYDLDGSKTINSPEELKQLCTNLVVKLELDMEVKTIDELCKSADENCKSSGRELDWPFEKFKEWFLEMFEPLPSWQNGDVSSSDDESGSLRSGTYDLVIDSGKPNPLRIRFKDAEGERVQLYEREANDEVLGYNGSEPRGLHTVTGSFDHGTKTCELIKRYKDSSLPVLEFKGKIESGKKISGSYTASGAIPAALGELKASGTFTMQKRPKDD